MRAGDCAVATVTHPFSPHPLSPPLQGAAMIISPTHKLPLAAAAAALAVVRSAKNKRKGGGATPPTPLSSSPSGADLASTGPVYIVFDKVGVSVPAGKKATVSSKQILTGVSGAARAGRFLAIMGPSGAGKTTLLHVLAGQLAASKGTRVTGRVLAVCPNGSSSPPPGPPRVAFVGQQDAFFSMLTVRETLTLAARLRAGDGAGAGDDAALAAEVEALLRSLGLAKVADARVGGAGPRARGLSGGERKRLAIACELVGGPPVLFADEPTSGEWGRRGGGGVRCGGDFAPCGVNPPLPPSGLDAFAAGRVVDALAALAAGGRTVVATIHQPRSSVFASFDDLVLLAEGRVVYSGPASDALPHFQALGHVCPPLTNPAEWLADLVAVDHSSPAAEAESGERVARLQAAWAASTKPGAPSPARGVRVGGVDHKPHVSVPSQLRLLAVRAWRQATRDKATTVARAVSNLSSAVIFGSIFWRLGRSQTAIQDRLGLLQVASINAAMSALVKTLNIFPKERAVVDRERAKGGYSPTSYFLSKLAAEAPLSALFPLLFGAAVYPAAGLNPAPGRFAKFLATLTLESFSSTALGLAVGAAAPTADAALALGPAVMVVFIVFGGVYVNAASVPRVLRWVPRASLIKHAFEGLAVGEFDGMAFDPTPAGGGGPPASKHGGGGSRGGAPGDLLDGRSVLTRLGYGDSTVASALRSQARVLAFNAWTALALLRARAPRYALADGGEEEEEEGLVVEEVAA